MWRFENILVEVKGKYLNGVLLVFVGGRCIFGKSSRLGYKITENRILQ